MPASLPPSMGSVTPVVKLAWSEETHPLGPADPAHRHRCAGVACSFLYQTTARGMARPRARLQRAMTENASVFTDAERRYLSDFRLGRIATVGRDGTPHVAPVGWSYDAEHDVIEVGGRDFARSKKYHDVKR